MISISISICLKELQRYCDCNFDEGEIEWINKQNSFQMMK